MNINTSSKFFDPISFGNTGYQENKNDNFVPVLDSPNRSSTPGYDFYAEPQSPESSVKKLFQQCTSNATAGIQKQQDATNKKCHTILPIVLPSVTQFNPMKLFQKKEAPKIDRCRSYNDLSKLPDNEIYKQPKRCAVVIKA